MSTTPLTKRIGRQYAASITAPPQSAEQVRLLTPLSNLDGPLSHLLSKQNEAKVDLARATLNVERFIAAFQVLKQEAGGELVNYDTLPPGVLDWVKEIRRRSEKKSTARVQRAD